MSEWEASHTGLTIDVDEQFIPSIVGKGGETIRSIQKETKCKIDIDKIHSTLTVREGTESARVEAMDRVKAIIEEEKAAAAERAAEREKLRQEQAELARSNAKTRDASSDQKPADAEEDLSGVKDRSREFSARPVGWAATKFKNNGANMDAIEVSLTINLLSLSLKRCAYWTYSLFYQPDRHQRRTRALPHAHFGRRRSR